MTDALGRVTIYQYDDQGRQVLVAQPAVGSNPTRVQWHDAKLQSTALQPGPASATRQPMAGSYSNTPAPRTPRSPRPSAMTI